MFAQSNPGTDRQQHWFRIASLALHAIVLAVLLHQPEPQKINPQSVASGQNGTSVTRLYWASKTPDLSTHSSSDSATRRYRRERLSHEALTFKAARELAKSQAQTHAAAQDDANTQTLSALGHGAQAGPSYGTLSRGSFYGDEIRPALPIATADPVVYPWQMPNYEGNEVIEITIDERGEIVRKTILQSMGPDIDAKCMAALENWHFHPATKNGAPIPSKQDAIFPFHARG